MTKMQKAIERILKAHGKLDEFTKSNEFHVKFIMPNFDPLVIERHKDRVSVAHYYECNGDLIPDPDIVFDYATWVPLELSMGPVGIYRSKFIYRDGKQYVDMRFDRDVRPLVTVWANNLIAQGWETSCQND